MRLTDEQEKSITLNFLNLKPSEMRKVLVKRRPGFRDLKLQEQAEFIGNIVASKQIIADRFEKGEKGMFDLRAPTNREIFEIVRNTSTGLSVPVGGAVGLAASGGNPMVGVAAAGLAKAGTEQLFEGIRQSLGVAGFKEFQDEEDASFEALPTVEQVASKLGEVNTDFATGAIDQMIGASIAAAPGRASATAVGAIGGAALNKENPIKGAVFGGAVTFGATSLGEQSGFTDKGARRAATEEFSETFKSKPGLRREIRSNVLKGRELQSRVKGLKIPQGDLTNNSNALRLQNRLLASEEGAALSQQDSALNEISLRKYFATEFSGKGDPNLFVRELGEQNTELLDATKEASDTVSLEVGRLTRNLDAEDLGEKVLTALDIPLQKLKSVQKEAYSKVGNIPTKTQRLADALEEVEAEIEEAGFKNTPTELEFSPTAALERIRNAIFETVETTVPDAGGLATKKSTEVRLRDVPLKKMVSIIQELDVFIKRTNPRSGNPDSDNTVLRRRLQILRRGIVGEYNKQGELTQEGVYQATEAAGDPDSDTIQTLKRGNLARREEAIRFEQGPVGKALQETPGEASKLGLANIAKEFDTPAGADELINALGSKEIAKEAMGDYFRFSILNNKSLFNTDTRRLNRANLTEWIKKHKIQLDKLGLTDEFKNTEKLQRALDASEDRLNIFNKSVAGRVLKAAPDEFVAQAFKENTEGNPARTVRDLLKLTRGNPEATQGLKRAVALHLLKISESTERAFLQGAKGGRNKIDAKTLETSATKMNNALSVLYADEPAKLKALKTAREAFTVLGRAKAASRGKPPEDTSFVAKVVRFGTSIAGAASPREAFAGKGVTNALREIGRGKIDAYLRRMVFDPDYALAILRDDPGGFKRFAELASALVATSGLVKPRVKSAFKDLRNAIATDRPFR